MRRRVAAIDPGKIECAVAFALDGVLAEVLSLPSFEFPSPCADRAVYEVPDRQDAPFDDLVQMAVAGAQLAAWLAPNVQRYYPREWKGQTPKPIHHARLWDVLYPAERKVLGGDKTRRAIDAACERGARERWKKSGKLYYRAREMPEVGSQKITHDILDAAALLMFEFGRLDRP